MKKVYGFLRKYIPAVVLFGVFLFVIQRIVNDFGVPWDAWDVYYTGEKYINYLLGQYDQIPLGKDLFLTKHTKSGIEVYYNYIYSGILNYFFDEMPGIPYEKFHFLNFAFFGSIILFAYAAIQKEYKNTFYALLSGVVILTMPRFFGLMGVNPKDGSFAAAYFISLCLIYLLHDVRREIKIPILMLSFLFTQSFRVLGFSIYGIYFLYELYYQVEIDRKLSLKKVFDVCIDCLMILIGAMLLMIISWPYLGSNVYLHFKEILRVSSKYHWNGEVLYWGKYIFAHNLPRTYLFTWIAISTPIYILILNVVSVLRFKKSHPLHMLFLMSVVIQLTLYIVLKPVIYDGLRHYLFILPQLGMLAVIGFVEIMREKRLRIFAHSLIIVIVVGLAFTINTMIVLHPYEYVYFNSFVGGLQGAEGQFETEYYGLSYKEAIEWIKENDSSAEIFVHSCGHVTSSTHYFNDRLKWTGDGEAADYYVCYTRHNLHEKFEGDVVHIVERQGVPLNYVKKITK